VSDMQTINASQFGHLGESEEAAIAKVEAVMLLAIDAHTRCDYEKFSSLCTDEFINQIDAEIFAETCNDMNPNYGPLEILVTASFAKAKNLPLIEWLWIE